MFKSKITSSEDKSGSFHLTANADERHIKEIIKALQDFLSDEIIENIKQIFKQFNNTLRIFEDYEYIVKCHYALVNMVDNLIAEGMTHLNEQLYILFCLKDLASKVVDSRRMEFMRYILDSPVKKKILFSNVFTEEDINKRYKKLSLNFHPDKTSNLNIPTVTQDECKNIGVELFKCILGIKESLFSSSKMDRLILHEEKGNEFWKIAIDYRNALKAKWDKLKLLKKEDLREISSEELKSASISNGQLAYKEYQAACKHADKDKQLKSQIKLRGYMALSLYISDQFLEAQLYALSSINLIYRNSSRCTRQDLYEAKTIFDKINNGNPNESRNTFQLNTEIKIKNSSNNSHALVKYKTLDDEYTFHEIEAINNSIKDDLKKISNELMLEANRKVVCWETNKEEILHAKERANSYKFRGGLLVTYGVSNIGANAVTLYANPGFYTAMAGGSVGISFVAVFTGIGILMLGVLGGCHLWKKGVQLLNEPKTRETLNEIIKQALIAYDKGEHQKFIEELSKKYSGDKSLIKLERFGPPINPEHIIETLLNHGFRPDGIAYLLNLIGEVLNSGKIKVDGITARKLKDNGSNVLMGVMSKKLKDEANKLDDSIKELRIKSGKSFLDRFIDWMLIRDRSDIAQKYIDDAEKMTFFSRLEEMRNTARINLTIGYILDGNPDDIKEAKTIIKEIQESIESHHQYIGIAETRLEAVKDLLWVVSGESPTFQIDIAIDC
jgi:hypothetical protein